MISAICSDIITAVTGITGVKTVGAWAGDVDALLQLPQNLPGVFVVYQGAQFSEAPATMGTASVDTGMQFQIIVIVHSLKAATDAALTAWTIIEAVRTALIGRQILTYNKLWPTSEDLIFSEGGLLVYGLNYSLDARI